MEGPSLQQVLKSERYDDLVEYAVFPEGDDEEAEEILLKLNAAALKIAGEYLWHYEPFVLRLGTKTLEKLDAAEDEDEEDRNEEVEAEKSKTIRYLRGITRFGDNVDDEWFVVYILRELTKMFPGLVVRVTDHDGEFILIEAAEYLPRWAESDESCKRRVYLYEGQVHLIPQAKDISTSPLPKGTPSTAQAINAIRNHSKTTLASKSIQEVISKRIGAYPEKMNQHFHHANLLLPPKLASILQERPSLVSAGVLAFYLRDPIDLKATRLMKNFKPSEGLVKTRVKFTKCLYAMLSKQDFRPDTKSGWTFPRPTSYEFKANSLGAKLTTGFEILMGKLNTKQQMSNGCSVSSESSPAWLRYEQSLKATGYFRDYLEGSKPYQQLSQEAKVFFEANLNGKLRNGGTQTDRVTYDLGNLFRTTQVDLEKLKRESTLLPPDDEDSWMDIKPEDLESLLETKFQSGGLNPEEIPTKLKEFMKQISDFSGVEPAGSGGNSGSDSPPSKQNGTSGSSQADDVEEPFDFKADDFVSAIDKLLHELGGLDGNNAKEWEDSEDDYGSDEDDFDVNLEDVRKMHKFSEESKIHELMHQMDSELAKTDVGKTFKKESGIQNKPKANGASSSSSSSSEAKKTSAKPKSAATASVDELDEYDEEEGLTPVNIDMNALANILESFQSQDGPSGPSANLLRSVGLDLSKMKK